MSTGILLYISPSCSSYIISTPSSRMFRVLQRKWNNCPVMRGALHNHLFSGLWPALGCYFNCHPLQKEKSFSGPLKQCRVFPLLLFASRNFTIRPYYWKHCILVMRHWEIKLELSWKWQYSPESQILVTSYRKQTKVQISSMPDMNYWGYLQEQKLLKDICITKAHPSMGDKLLKAGNLENTAKLLGFLGGRAGLSRFQAAQLVFLLGDLTIYFFQAASLGSGSSRRPLWAELLLAAQFAWRSLKSPSCLYLPGEEGPNKSPPFQWLSEVGSIVYLLGIKDFTFPKNILLFYLPVNIPS